MKIYVGNLPYEVDAPRLGEIFGAFGETTSTTVVVDRTTGRSKGYGFVEMADDDARKAILALNRTQLDGRTIWVNEARAKG
ncbi:MAG: RNA-binding protein [Thermoanaerobaculia bacterium]|jgi:cold-inducible RNA-binding protein|nr:RNA-binding protein [Thermoanaerobaculia bacterium]